MSKRTISEATPNVTSSPASEDGPWPLASQDGQMTDLSGAAVVHASPTRSGALRMAERKAKVMNATSGRISSGSSKSARLQLLLESRLQMRFLGDGLTRFSGTWKARATPARRRFLQHVPQEPSIGANGSIGWPSPAARDGKDISRSNAFLSQRQRHSPSMATRWLELGRPWEAITAIYCLAMGYPLLWNEKRPRDTGTRLSRKSQQSS